jgi:predicted Rossmann fold flavoprotein
LSDADVVVVGAGAAGLAASIFTRRLAPTLSVRILDSARKPGAKILVSGGARCNVTNARVSEQDFWGGKRAVIRRVLQAFSVAETIAFFDELGVSLHEEEHGKLFPDTNRARDVLEALLREVDRAGARLTPATRATAIERFPGGFRVETSDGPLDTRAVVLATGGKSLPKTGSDGAGYDFARRFGHTIVPTVPGLTPLVLADSPTAIHQQLSGVSHDVDIDVWVDDALALRLNGSLLWTHFGISGPVVLNASRHWLRAKQEGRAVRLTASFCPGERFEQVDVRLSTFASGRPRASVATAVSSIVPASSAQVLLDRLQIEPAASLAHFPRSERRRLSHALAEWPLDVADSRGYNYAEVTAGGVALDEIDPSTMESRKCPGLFLIGEILDVDGRIGGFNFQWAWSSARSAARGLTLKMENGKW